MDTPAPLPLTDRFARIIQVVLQGLGTRYRADSILGPAVAAALLNLIALRLQNLRRRFVTLVERIQAGTLRKLPEPGTARARKPAARSAERKRRPNLLAGYGVREVWGWVVNIACRNGDELQRLLEDPEMQAMIAAEPRRMGRILRPLCRMLGVGEIPDLLRLPSQADVVTVDWAAHARMVEAEKAATAAGLPPPPWDPPPFTGTRDRPFRFYLTRYGQPLLAHPLLAHPLLE
ncbi:MAG TPA: hypothetical protein VHS58_23320 [Acetobacteraceae bacterium]|nr:hypothetical protein [Acetobacteraceae bacterium]